MSSLAQVVKREIGWKGVTQATLTKHYERMWGIPASEETRLSLHATGRDMLSPERIEMRVSTTMENIEMAAAALGAGIVVLNGKEMKTTPLMNMAPDAIVLGFERDGKIAPLAFEQGSLRFIGGTATVTLLYNHETNFAELLRTHLSESSYV